MATTHFTDKELECKCGCGARAKHETFEMLEEVRSIYGYPMRVNSGMRCLQYNRTKGSSDDSQHPKGLAADIHVPDDRRKCLLLEAAFKSERVRFIQVYDTFIHLDCRHWNLDYKMMRGTVRRMK